MLLGERLDAQIGDASDGIGRRLEQAGVEAQLQTLDDRYAMLRAEAAYDHNDPGKIEGLAMVAEQAAAHEARLSDHDDPQSLATERRNAVWQSGIEANLDKGQPREALALYDRSKGSLGEVLTTEMKDVATDVEAEDWVRRQEGKPTQETADAALADPDLSPAARLRAYQKVQAHTVGTENARVAEVERLDAALASTTKTLATNPSNFKRGTLASLADGYQKADETDTAAMLRAQAEQESFLRGYAQSPAQAQQRILDTLPEGPDRTLLEQIGKHQADAFDKDPWIAGTAIYPDVGAPKPVSDFPGRINQARLIAQHRGGIEVLPFSGAEISTLRKNIPAAPPKEQTDTLKELATLPPEILPPLASALVGKNGSDDFQSRSLGSALSFHADGAPEIADQVLRGAKLTQEKGDLGKPVIATTLEWNNELRARLSDSEPVPPIVRDTIANIYTHNAERAGQGDEIDTDLLDKAIDITKDNIARQPEIMLLPYIISPDALNGCDSDVMLTPYAIEPEAPIERNDGAMPPSDETLPETPVGGDNNGKQTPPDEISPETPVEGDNRAKTPPGEISPEAPTEGGNDGKTPSDETSSKTPGGSNSTVRLTPYVITPETFRRRDSNVVPARFRRDPPARIVPEEQKGVFPPGDVILAQAPGGSKRPELTDDTVRKLFTSEFQALPDFQLYLEWLRKSPLLIQQLNDLAAQGGNVELGKREPDGFYKKGTYFASKNTPDRNGNPRKTPALVIAPNIQWTIPQKPDGTNLYPNDRPTTQSLLATTIAHETGHAFGKDGTPNIFLKEVRTAADAVALTLLGEGVAIWNE